MTKDKSDSASPTAPRSPAQRRLTDFAAVAEALSYSGMSKFEEAQKMVDDANACKR